MNAEWGCKGRNRVDLEVLGFRGEVAKGVGGIASWLPPRSSVLDVRGQPRPLPKKLRNADITSPKTTPCPQEVVERSLEFHQAAVGLTKGRVLAAAPVIISPCFHKHH